MNPFEALSDKKLITALRGMPVPELLAQEIEKRLTDQQIIVADAMEKRQKDIERKKLYRQRLKNGKPPTKQK